MLAGERGRRGQRHEDLQQAQLQHRRRAREGATVAGLATACWLLCALGPMIGLELMT